MKTASLVFIALSLTSCVSSSGDKPSAAVTYSVSGKSTYDGGGHANVSYTNSTGGNDSEEVQIPWSKSVALPSSHVVSLSAQRMLSDSGEISATISRPGFEPKSSHSRGPYADAVVAARYQ